MQPVISHLSCSETPSNCGLPNGCTCNEHVYHQFHFCVACSFPDENACRSFVVVATDYSLHWSHFDCCQFAHAWAWRLICWYYSRKPDHLSCCETSNCAAHDLVTTAIPRLLGDNEGWGRCSGHLIDTWVLAHWLISLSNWLIALPTLFPKLTEWLIHLKSTRHSLQNFHFHKTFVFCSRASLTVIFLRYALNQRLKSV